jgi:DNA replication protein DnaC
MSSRYTELNSQLHALKLPTMAESFSEIALKAARNGLSHEAYLHELVRLEWEAREQRRRARLLSESGLPREKTFRTLQLGAFPPLIRQQIERLRSGAFVQQAVNVVVVGKPGAGKSHLLASLGHALVEQGYPVLWRSTAHLMQRLLAAKRDLRLPQELAKLDRYACLILDDIGYVQHDQDEMEILFTLLRPRYPYCAVPLSLHPISVLDLLQLTAAVRVFVPAIVRPLPPSSQLPLLPAVPHLLAQTPRRWLPAVPSSPASTALRSVSVAARSGDDRLTSSNIHAASALFVRS